MRTRMTVKSRRQLFFVVVVPVVVVLSASMLLKVTSLATRNNTRKIAKVAFVSSSQSYSGYGVTSPEPNPTWNVVADQLAKRLPNFAEETSQPTASSPQTQRQLQQTEATDPVELIETQSFDVAQLQPTDLNGFDVVVALGVGSTTENSNNNNKVNKEEEEQRFLKALDHCSSNSNSSRNGNSNNNSNIVALLADPTCSSHILNRRFAGKYGMASSSSSDASATASTSTTNTILQEATASIPWTDVASSKRLLEKTE